MWTSNSGEAVSGLSGLSGTILVSCLILLVIGLVAGVVAVVAHKKAQQSGLAAGALAQVGRVAFAAAVITNAGALVMALSYDTHAEDRLSLVRLTTGAFREAGRVVTSARIPVIVQEGGYQVS